MFLTSLYFYLVKEGVFRNMTLRQFSRIARIDMSSAAMRLPVASKERIWKGTRVLEVIQEEYSHCPINTLGHCIDTQRAKELSERLVDASPVWLRYKREEMVSDTLPLITRE
jgi:hypothetical protein